MRGIENDGEHDRAHDGIPGVEAAEDTVREVDNRQVVDEVLHADGQAREVVDDEGETAEAAREQVRRDEEQVEAQARDEAAQSNLQIALQVLPYNRLC